MAAAREVPWSHRGNGLLTGWGCPSLREMRAIRQSRGNARMSESVLHPEAAPEILAPGVAGGDRGIHDRPDVPSRSFRRRPPSSSRVRTG